MSRDVWLGVVLATQDGRAAKLRRQLRQARRRSGAGHRAYAVDAVGRSAGGVAARILLGLLMVAGVVALVRGEW